MANNAPVVVTAAAAQWGADVLQIDDAGPSIQLAAADPQRRTVGVYSDANSVGILFLTPTAGVTAGGIRIIPGAGFEFNVAGAIYGRAEGGDVLVNVITQSGTAC